MAIDEKEWRVMPAAHPLVFALGAALATASLAALLDDLVGGGPGRHLGLIRRHQRELAAPQREHAAALERLAARHRRVWIAIGLCGAAFALWALVMAAR